MSLYQRGNVWYYLFYVNGRRYRGSTKTDNEKEAGRIYARALAAAEAGESPKPKRAPLVQDFVKEFKDWLDTTTLKQRTKADYKNGCRLILRSPLRVCGWIRSQRMTSRPPTFTSRWRAGIAPCGPCGVCSARPGTES